jgi:hypothetical protein
MRTEPDQAVNHTGKELQLMLAGKKPLSMFYDDADEELDERIVPEKKFGKLVETGEFGKAERIFDLAYDPRVGRNRRVRYVLYLPERGSVVPRSHAPCSPHHVEHDPI